jgi:hypothetical protein
MLFFIEQPPEYFLSIVDDSMSRGNGEAEKRGKMALAVSPFSDSPIHQRRLMKNYSLPASSSVSTVPTEPRVIFTLTPSAILTVRVFWDPVAFLQLLHHLFVFFHLFLLRADENKVKDGEDGEHHNEAGHPAPLRPCISRRSHCICDCC